MKVNKIPNCERTSGLIQATPATSQAKTQTASGKHLVTLCYSSQTSGCYSKPNKDVTYRQT